MLLLTCTLEKWVAQHCGGIVSIVSSHLDTLVSYIHASELLTSQVCPKGFSTALKSLLWKYFKVDGIDRRMRSATCLFMKTTIIFRYFDPFLLVSFSNSLVTCPFGWNQSKSISTKRRWFWRPNCNIVASRSPDPKFLASSVSASQILTSRRLKESLFTMSPKN